MLSTLYKLLNWLSCLLSWLFKSSLKSSRINNNHLKFLLDFEQSFGSIHPPFYQGSYSDALKQAKNQYKILLCILLCDDHDDTFEFSKKVLTNNALIHLVETQDLICWCGNVDQLEGFQVSNLLSATTYPFLALICQQGNQMTCVERIQGLLKVDEIISILSRSIERVKDELVTRQQEILTRQQERQLRIEQDLAYQQSLQKDQQKEQERKRKEEQQEQEMKRKEKEEQDKKEKKRIKLLMKKEKQLNLPKEPTQNYCNVLIRLPNGDRITRKFDENESIEQLMDFVDCLDLDVEKEYEIVNVFPRRVLTSGTFKQVGLSPNGAIIVEEK